MIFNKNAFLFILLGIFLLMAGCSSQSEKGKSMDPKHKAPTNAGAAEKTVPANSRKVSQIHGIGYPGNDNSLYVATNNGLKFYRESKWLEYSANHHNYMSFQAVEAGFIASGHPEQGTGLKDPLGLVESNDKGKSLKKLAFYGESNFHFLSASFLGSGIYMINEKPVSQLSQGVYYSKNSGKSWDKSNLFNLSADSLGMIAVHAKNGNIMAMATRTGIFYSEDYGNTMKSITAPIMVTALTFIGDEIVYSSVEGKSIFLKKVNPKTGEQTNMIFPFLDYNNPVTYLAADSKNENKLAFSTYNNDLYESLDGGKDWNNIMANGQTEQE